MFQKFIKLTKIVTGNHNTIAMQTIEIPNQSFNRPVIGLEQLFIRRIPYWKRGMDIVGAIVGLVLFMPVMLAVVIAIKLTSKGPAIFKQKRVGQEGKPFILYKFRSMFLGAEDKKKELMKFNERTGPTFKMTADPRVTPIGKLIRKWSLDELPQFYNVLKGDMSLVGPRPPTTDEVPKYDNWQNRRLEVKPGITCIWQISARHKSSFEEWIRLDIDYVRRQSFLLDLKILFLTLPAVLSKKGAH